MDALEFLKERNRMCKSFNRCSDGCPAWSGSCKLEIGTVLECEADKQVEIVNKWAAAHQRKTRQSVFLEQWPDAQLDCCGIVEICPSEIDTTIHQNCSADKCGGCRREFWMQEVE